MSVDIALDLPRMARLSVGMTAYVEELARRLPRVAPDLRFESVVRTSGLDRCEQVDLPLLLRRLHPRLVHYLSVYAPLVSVRPYVITIHDLVHLRFPAYFKRSVGPYYRTVVRAVCAGAARVITDDERTLPDLQHYLGVPPEKVRIVPLGIDDAFLAPVEPALAERPYFFYAGNHRPHKDLETLFRAWEALDPALEADLVLTGHDDDDIALVRPRRQRGRLRFAGHVPQTELARLYCGAIALVYPSRCEGFGLPMVEAAAVGTPVIASADAVPGVLRPHADVFATRDVAALTRLLERRIGAPHDGDAARAVARTLTWDRCAERTAEVYRDVLAETSGR